MRTDSLTSDPASTRLLRASALLAVILGLGFPPATALADPFDLEGTWFVVAHFQDETTANPDAMRWVDEVWTFEKKGSRLEWAKYPIVVFDDTTGRFEARGRNARSRVLAAWEPNEDQLSQLMEGPRVNTRGSKTKTLKGSPEKGWKSAGRQQMRSLSVVGYQENWSITDLGGMPLFSRVDMMGNAGTKNAEGQTTFQITALGERPSGIYERDGVRKGTFFMLRTPAPRGLEKKEGTVNERFGQKAMDRALEEWNEAQKAGEGENPD